MKRISSEKWAAERLKNIIFHTVITLNHLIDLQLFLN